MKKCKSLVEAFTDANKQILKASPVMEPGDIYLAYCAMALCTIADKMADGSGPLFDPGEAKDDKLS